MKLGDKNSDIPPHMRRARQCLPQQNRKEAQRRQACDVIVCGQTFLAGLNADPFIKGPVP
jgi:hypothetical protein